MARSVAKKRFDEHWIYLNDILGGFHAKRFYVDFWGAESEFEVLYLVTILNLLQFC